MSVARMTSPPIQQPLNVDVMIDLRVCCGLRFVVSVYMKANGRIMPRVNCMGVKKTVIHV